MKTFNLGRNDNVLPEIIKNAKEICPCEDCRKETKTIQQGKNVDGWAMTETIKDTKEKIIEEFDNIFDHIVPSQGGFIVGKKGTKYDNVASDLEEIKDFLSDSLSTFEKEIRDKVLGEIKEERIKEFKRVVECGCDKIIDKINNLKTN